jgi:hypothetical protein
MKYKIILPKEEQCTCKEHDPYCCQIHGNCPTCVKKEEPKTEKKSVKEQLGMSKVPAGVDPKVWNVMTPEEKALFK